MLTAILTIVLFCIMIIPHELGHFVVAKLCGVQVNEFSMGMGPLLFQRQKGETLYSVRLFPVGGYCAMEGEDEESENPRAFGNKCAWQKIAVLLAGAAMNVLTAILIMIIAMTVMGIPTNTLDSVVKNSPAYEAGIQAGDTVVAVNGQKTDSWSAVVKAIDQNKKGDRLSMTVERNGNKKEYTVTPTYSKKDKRMMVGIACKQKHSLISGVKYGVITTGNLNKLMVQSLKMLFTGKLSKNDVSGPVGMVSIVNQTATQGVVPYLYLAAIICLNLAYINLLPLPALDGGRILFVIIRKITGNRITDNMEGYVHLAGMVLLIAFTIFITWNDIMKLIG